LALGVSIEGRLSSLLDACQPYPHPCAVLHVVYRALHVEKGLVLFVDSKGSVGPSYEHLIILNTLIYAEGTWTFRTTRAIPYDRILQLRAYTPVLY
jgi:hypothetical protein